MIAIRLRTTALLVGLCLMLTSAWAGANPAIIMAGAAATHITVNPFNLFPPVVSGLCAVSTPAYVAVLDDNKQYHVFVLPGNFVPPPGLNPGRRIKVVYGKRADGVLEVKKIKVLGPI